MVRMPRTLSSMQQTAKIQSPEKKWHLQHSTEPATDVVKEDTKRQIVTPRNIQNGRAFTPKGGGGQGSNNNKGSKNNSCENSNQKKKQFQGNCNYCSKFGHKQADCHKKAADQKNGGNEAAAVAVSSGNNVEFLLCAKAEYGMMAMGTTKLVFPDSYSLCIVSSTRVC